MYIENAINKVKATCSGGVRIGGERIKMIRFADDIVLLGETEREVNDLVKQLQLALLEYRLKANRNILKVMKFYKVKNRNRLNVILGIGWKMS